MSELPTRQELFDVGRQYILTHAKRVTPEMVEVPGSELNLVNAANSYFGAALMAQIGQRFNALIQAGSDGDDLTRLGFDRYQLNPVGAQSAFVPVTISRVAAGPAGTISNGTLVQAPGNIVYELADDVVFLGSTLKVENVLARAVNAGKDYQIGANKINAFVFPGALFDMQLRVTNPVDSFFPGQDPEANDVFRERIHDFWLSVERGTLAAIELGAMLVPGITRANATEVFTTDSHGLLKPARVVQLYVANDSGAVTNDLISAVYESLEEHRAAGLAVLVTPAVPQLVDLVLRLHFIPGIQVATLVEQIKTSLLIVVNALGPNKPLLRSSLYNVLAQYRNQGLIVDSNAPATSTIVEPAGDLVPRPSRSIRVTLNTINVEIV